MARAQEDTNKVSEIVYFHSSLLPDFQNGWEKAKNFVNLIFGDHWTTAQKDAHIAVGTKPRNIPVLFNKFMTILGLEKQARDKFVAEAVGAEDELSAFITNIRFRHWEQGNTPRYDYIKSDMFIDHLFNGYSVMKIEKKKTPMGEWDIAYKYVPYNQFIFDTNFKDYEMGNCSRRQEFEWVYYDELVAMYPEIKQFPALNVGAGMNANSPLKNLKDFYSFSIPDNPKSKKLVKIIYDEKVIWKKVYEVHSIKTDEDIWECDTKKEAEKYVKDKMKSLREEANAQYQQQLGTDMLATLPPKTMNEKDYYAIKPETKKRIEYTVLAGQDIIAETVVMPYDESAYKVLFGYFVQGKWWSWVEIMADFQNFIDKTIAMLDLSMGIDMKTVFQLVTSNLHTDMTIEDALKIVSTGGVIPSLTGEELIRKVAREGAPPEYFNFISLLLQMTDDAGGGKNFYGGQQGADESGKAIQERKQAAFSIYITTLDNLRRTEEQVGKYTLMLAKDTNTGKYVKKVLGADVTDKLKEVLAHNKIYSDSLFEQGYGYLTVEDLQKPFELEMPNAKESDKPVTQRAISDGNLQITVKKVQTTLNEKDEKLQKLMYVAKNFGWQVDPKIVANLLELDPIETEAFVNGIMEQRQIQAQQMKQQADAQHLQMLANLGKQAGDLAMKEPSNTPQPREQNGNIVSQVLQQ